MSQSGHAGSDQPMPYVDASHFSDSPSATFTRPSQKISDRLLCWQFSDDMKLCSRTTMFTMLNQVRNRRDQRGGYHDGIPV